MTDISLQDIGKLQEAGLNVTINVSPALLQEMITEAVKRALKSFEVDKTTERKLITVEETMEMANVSRTTLWRLERQGILKPVKIKHLVRYRKNDIDELVNNGELK